MNLQSRLQLIIVFVSIIFVVFFYILVSFSFQSHIVLLWSHEAQYK